MARVFISATKQNVGKTTTSIGLFAAFKEAGHKVHFIKPVGQRYVRREDV
ncbi:MAG: AAA family ATPase, partial [Myxococcales bacterium]|nr:AAA family ATPase [Myxococcales bacterium]